MTVYWDKEPIYHKHTHTHKQLLYLLFCMLILMFRMSDDGWFLVMLPNFCIESRHTHVHAHTHTHVNFLDICLLYRIIHPSFLVYNLSSNHLRVIRYSVVYIWRAPILPFSSYTCLGEERRPLFRIFHIRAELFFKPRSHTAFIYLSLAHWIACSKGVWGKSKLYRME